MRPNLSDEAVSEPRRTGQGGIVTLVSFDDRLAEHDAEPRLPWQSRSGPTWGRMLP